MNHMQWTVENISGLLSGRNFLRVLFGIAFILSFAAGPDTSTAFAAEPIKIGVSLGLTGRHAEVSRLQEKSFRLWEQDVNRKGGLLNRKVKLIIYDNKSNPQTARSDYQYLINTEKADLLFAPYSSELTEAILPVTEQHGYPIIASGASGDSLWQKGYKSFFGLYSVASRYTIGFLEMLLKYRFRDIAIIYADDAFSKDIAAGTNEFARKFGLQVRQYSEFPKGTTDFINLVRTTQKSGAGVLIVCAYFDEAVYVKQALRKTGWHPKVYYASVGPALPAFKSKLGEDANYTFSSSQWERHGKLPGSEAFFSEFLKTYGEEPSYHAANAYAAGQLLEMAVKKVGSLDKEKIRDVLFSMNNISIIGRYGVDKNGRQIKHFPLIIQWQKGKKEIVWPNNLRTAKPAFK
jgi:branched-chain amino acid transport system substrate-binding protein